MHVIESEDYRRTRLALMADPIIQWMEQDISRLPDHEIMQEDDETPTYNFMIGALEQYKRLGGEIRTHIGGPAEAVIMLRKAR